MSFDRMSLFNAIMCILTLTMVSSQTFAQQHTLEDLFPTDRVLQIDITLDEDDWDEIRNQTRGFAEALQPARQFGPVDSPYAYVDAEVTIDGVRYPAVGLRKKGFIGSQDNERPSLKIKLNRTDTSANIGGLKNLTLNNNKQDRSLMSQFLGYGIFNAAGSPAPRTAYASVTVNGRDLGVYCHVETVREPLLKRGYGDDSGTLLEGTVVDFHPDWEQSFERKIGKDKPARTRITELTSALAKNTIDLDEIWSIVDEESFYRFWTVEGLLSFWDGYSGNRNNFFIYLDPNSGKFHFIPWGADCMFETYSQLGEDRNAPRSVRMQGRLANRLYQLPEVRAEYARRMRLLLEEVFNEEKLLAETERIETMITPHLGRGQKWNVDFDAIRTFIKGRRAAVEPEVRTDDMPMWAYPLEAPPVIDRTTWKKGTLANAVRNGDLKAIRKHIASGERINRIARGTGSILGAAALNNQPEAMKLLIRYGADVDIANPDGNTPLHAAAFLGYVDCARILLDAGADPNPLNEDEETPLDSSAAPWSNELRGVVDFIADYLNIDVDMNAVRTGRPQVVALLKERGGMLGRELAPPTEMGLGVAAKKGDLESLRTQLGEGADPNRRDKDSITPLCWAVMADQKEAAELLIKSGADINGRNGDGAAPLHAAAFLGRTAMVEMLLENGADRELRNNEGNRPIDSIAAGWSPEIQGIVVWISGYLDLEIDPADVRDAWPGIQERLGAR